MADLNKVILIGRLTRDPEVKTLNSGTRIASMSMAVGNRKKNAQTGQWEDDPMYIDVNVFSRPESKTVDLISERLTKGSQICVEGKLVLDSWEDKSTGQRRTKHKILADNVQFLDSRRDATGGGGGNSNVSQSEVDIARRAALSEPFSGDEDDIPF